MHKKILLKFNKIEKKFGEEFSISKGSLYSLILNKNFSSRKISISNIIKNLILIFLSSITILLCKLKKIKIANYFIIHKNSKEYDNRSKYILQNFNLKKSMNIIRCQTFTDSLKIFFLYPNVFFYIPIDFFSSFFLFKKKTIVDNYLVLHKKELRIYRILKSIFKFLKIKKFLTIDDQRILQTFLKVCKELNISSVGYMHYKFSKYSVAIKYLTFDHFFVWSNYFKKKLIELNKKYKKKRIIITGYPNKKVSNIKNKKINILYLLDLNIDFKKTIKFLKDLSKNNEIELFLKFKPQHKMSPQWIKFCQKEKIKYFESESLDYINTYHNIDYFIATISTALLESTLYKAIPIKLMTNNDFAEDMIKDKIVLKANNFNDVKKIIKNNNKKKLRIFFNKVWGKKKYQTKKIKKILYKIMQ